MHNGIDFNKAHELKVLLTHTLPHNFYANQNAILATRHAHRHEHADPNEYLNEAGELKKANPEERLAELQAQEASERARKESTAQDAALAPW